MRRSAPLSIDCPGCRNTNLGFHSLMFVFHSRFSYWSSPPPVLPSVSFISSQAGPHSVFGHRKVMLLSKAACCVAPTPLKITFSMMSGHYQYNFIAYRLVNVASFFELFINDILRDMLHQFVIIYLDDILIYSRTYAEHVDHVRLVLSKKIVSTLIPKFLDPDWPFIVEVNASEDRDGTPEKLHPCAAFLRKLTQTECIYDIGNCSP